MSAQSKSSFDEPHLSVLSLNHRSLMLSVNTINIKKMEPSWNVPLCWSGDGATVAAANMYKDDPAAQLTWSGDGATVAAANMYKDDPAAQLTWSGDGATVAAANMYKDDPAAQLTIASIRLWLILVARWRHCRNSEHV